MKNIEVKKLLYQDSEAFKEGIKAGRTEAIEKACKWIKKYTYQDCGHRIHIPRRNRKNGRRRCRACAKGKGVGNNRGTAKKHGRERGLKGRQMQEVRKDG